MRQFLIGLTAFSFAVGCETAQGFLTEKAVSRPQQEESRPEQAEPNWRETCPKPTASGPRNSLTLSLEYTSSESSKDSNSSRLSAEYDGHILTLYGPYGTCTRGRCMHKEVAFVPTQAEIIELQAGLERHDLWIGLNEEANTDFSERRVGSTHTTTMALKLTDEQRTVSSTVAYGSAYGRETVKTGSDAARQKANAVHRVLIDLHKTALRCFPDFHTQ